MQIFDWIITQPLMWLVRACYALTHDYIISIIIFALVVKVVLFVFSLWSQIQSVKLAQIKPQLDDIRAYFSHDWRQLMREQRALYRQHKYSSVVTMLPLLLQVPIIIGVIRGLDSSGILAKPPANLWLPLLSAASAFALCYVQNLCNVLARAMGFWAKWGMAIFLSAFSLYFTMTSGVGFGVYWISGNILAIGVQLLCNALYNPRKYVTYQVLPRPKPDPVLRARQRQKQRLDIPRFHKTAKKLVFYSEASGFFKYFRGMIEYVLEHSRIRVHYLTSDIDDQAFQFLHPRFEVYYCDPSKLIVALMKLDCRVCVMSMPDLERFQYKRSIVNRKIEYIYVDHGLSSLTYVARKHAFDHFDTLFCYGPHYNAEARAMEKHYNTPPKNLVNTGYALFHQLAQMPQKTVPSTTPTIIIAPSWQRGNILESCIDPLMSALEGAGWRVIIRPHPEFIKRFPAKIAALQAKYANEFQLDFATSIFDADVLISDWSSVAWEFCVATNRPAIFVNTPPKIMNPDWDQYGITPIEISLRTKIGVTIDVDAVGDILSSIEQLATITDPRTIIADMCYDNSQADVISGQYLIEAVKRNK